MIEPSPPRRLTVVICGAGPASQAATLVRIAKQRGWAVEAIATPSALPFIDTPEIEHLAAGTLRSEYPQPDPNRIRAAPGVHAVIVAPGTYNTICKLSAGISDTYALGVLAEAVGAGRTVVILPFVNTALAARAPFQRAVDSLRAEGVRILLGSPGWTPHPPGTGGLMLSSFPWEAALDAVDTATPSPPD